MKKIAKLLAKAVDPELYAIDPENPNWTTPKTWGTFSIPGKHQDDGEKFRFGNYPVRMTELKKEFDEVLLVSLFENRNDAETLADLLKTL